MNLFKDESGWILVTSLSILTVLVVIISIVGLLAHSIVGIILLVIAPFIYPLGRLVEKKIKGVRAYRLARQQQPVTPEAAKVTVHELSILDVTATHIRCRVSCEPGFYMRSLAHDLGSSLGCGACLETLRREQSGAFRLQQSISLNTLENMHSDTNSHLLSISSLLPGLPRLVVTANGQKRASHGNNLSRSDILSADREWGAEPVRLFNEQGQLLAIAKGDAALLLHPVIVLV